MARRSICAAIALTAVVPVVATSKPRAQQHRQTAEMATGVDDGRFFNVPAYFDVEQDICGLGDKRIVSAASVPIVYPDSEMRRVGICTDADFRLYARENHPAELFVKTDTYRYIAVRLQRPEAGSASPDQASKAHEPDRQAGGTEGRKSVGYEGGATLREAATLLIVGAGLVLTGRKLKRLRVF